jgi:hypothetical protein
MKEGELDWSHVRRSRLLEQAIEGEKEGRRERRRQQLLGQFKGAVVYWELKEEVLDRTLWRTRFGSG